MREIIIILACLAFFIYAFNGRSRHWFAHLNGWQKLFGLIAVIMAVLILMNPDFLALGLLGDTTFFDVLVMALSLQMLVFVQWAWRSLSTAFFKSTRWIPIPSAGLRCLLAIWAVAFGSAVSAVQKVVHRILS
jgi:uncharacterized membrane protein YkgB